MAGVVEGARGDWTAAEVGAYGGDIVYQWTHGAAVLQVSIHGDFA